MKKQDTYTRHFPTYSDAAQWCHDNGYDQSVLEQRWVVTLRGKHAENAHRGKPSARAIAEQEHLASTGAFPEDRTP